MHLEQLLATVTNEPVQHHLRYPASWCQGRTAFGGLSSAFALQAMSLNVEPSRKLRSVNVNFIAPLLPDQDFSLTCTKLRESKNSSQFLVTLTQNEQTCLLVQGLYAKDKASEITVPCTHTMALKPVDPARILPYQEGVMPAFFQHVNLNIQQGNMPFTQATSSHLAGWMKLKQQQQPYQDTHILTLMDAWPPTQLQLYPCPAPASTMTWYVEFINHPTLACDQWLGYDVKTVQAQNGYGFEEGEIWSQDGTLLALTRQTVALFA